MILLYVADIHYLFYKYMGQDVPWYLNKFWSLYGIPIIDFE